MNNPRLYVSYRYQRTKQFQNQYKKQGCRCAICNNHLPIDKTTRDHIVPKAFGGRNNWLNIQLVCFECNQKKGKSFSPSFYDKILLHQIRVLNIIISYLIRAVKKSTAKLAEKHGYKTNPIEFKYETQNC